MISCNSYIFVLSQMIVYYSLWYPVVIFNLVSELLGARGSVVVKAPCYKPQGQWFDI
jgi:hypothetical protein